MDGIEEIIAVRQTLDTLACDKEYSHIQEMLMLLSEALDRAKDKILKNK